MHSQARTLLPMVVDDIPAGVLVAHGAPHFPIVVVNRMAEDLLGCPRADLLGLPAGSHAAAFTLMRPSGSAPVDSQGLPLHRTVYLGEVLRDEEWTILRPNGTGCTVLVNTNPIRNDAGKIVGGITCLRDITHLKEMEGALRNSERRLREADQRKDQFLAILAHELRGPLAPARTVAEILKAKSRADPSLTSLGNILERQIAALARLLDDVLDLSRVAIGKLRLELRVMELAPVVEEALEWAKPAIAARRHQLRVHVPTAPVRVEGDSGRLAQVFSNLLTNAAKYTEPGGDIEVTLGTLGSSALVTVRDTGRGLDESDMTYLFDLFFQPERTLDRAEGGLGIGLSLVRSLVQMHGGTIRAKSAGRGKGSEFVVSLPLVTP